LARGERVTCVDNLVGTGGSTRNVDHLIGEPRFELVTEDILSWAGAPALEGVGAIFHLAASKNVVCLSDPERDLAVNALGTLRLVRAAARAGVRKLVHSSTGSVFGEAGRPHSEEVPKRPVSFYGTSKLAGETYCRIVAAASGLDVTILRYYHVIGPRQDGSEFGGVVPIFVSRALRGEPLTIDGDGGQTRTFTSVRDAVRANLIARDRPESRGATYTCASGLRVSILELARYVLEQTGSGSPVRHGPARAGDIRAFDVDNGELRRLGLEFDTDWKAMVREVIASLSPPGSA
jgi:UDP-glucose 4-epimerase